MGRPITLIRMASRSAMSSPEIPPAPFDRSVVRRSLGILEYLLASNTFSSECVSMSTSVSLRALSVLTFFSCAQVIGGTLCAVSCCAATGGEPAGNAPVTSSEETVTRGLKFVREAGKQWISDRGCVSCHQVPAMIWSHEAANAAGFEIPLQELQELEKWSTEVASFVKPHQREELDEASTMASNIDTMAQMLLAIPKREGAAWRKKFAKKLAAEQAEDGSWRACGQLPMQRRPQKETTATTTLWTTLALLRAGEDFRPNAALKFADQVKEPVSAEYLAVRLLVAHQLGDNKLVNSLQQKLLRRQHADGGWGWRREDSSDALGTGYAMYALAATGVDAAALNSARDFLTNSQENSGRWPVPGTKRSAKGRATETAIDWGTAWAVIALSAVIDR